MRKGRERRKNLAKSVQESARSASHRQSDLSSSFRSSITGSQSPLGRQDNPAATMPPPATPLQKRQSLPVGFDLEQAQSESAKGKKRKRDDAITDDHHRTPRPNKITHRRSQTVGNSIMSAPPHGLSHSPYKSRIDISEVPEGSMLSDILMKQARHLAPTAKCDTTRTDYFRLKALGIDPDTPVVPLTKKRPRTESATTGKSRSTRPSTSDLPLTLRPTSQTASENLGAPPKTSQAADDEDEALFAQLRSVREALAETEQWMQTERQSFERSVTPQPISASPPNVETPAQRRLREIKERGPTPSRTELRLRAMGDKALLPKGFWDGKGMGLSLVKKGREKEVTTPTPPSRSNGSNGQVGTGLMGFAALGQQGQINGAFGGLSRSGIGIHRQDSEEAMKVAGASVEDAIEL